jgi:cardiolipin synthase
MSTHNEIWEISREEIVDQRAAGLPACWIQQPATSGRRRELSAGGVHQTGRQGEVLKLLCEAVASARETVVASSFLLAEPKLEDAFLAAAQRGVRVYLLLASETRLGRDPHRDDEFGEKCLADHVRLLNRLTGWAHIRSAPCFHAKTLLVDPHKTGRGFLSTANLTTEGLMRNEELVVELEPVETRQAFEMLRWAMWEAAEHELVEAERFIPVKPLGEIRPPAADKNIRAVLGATDTITEAALQIIRDAKTDLVISSFGWQADHPVVKALCERAVGGLRVTVLARPRSAVMPALLALRRAGARVLGFNYLHAKAVWNDGGDAMVMTSNFEPLHAGGGFELGVRLGGERAAALSSQLNSWIQSAPWILEANPTLGNLLGTAMFCDGKERRYITAVKALTIDLGDVPARSLELMAETKAPHPKAAVAERPAHELRFRYRVVPPRLVAKSHERTKPAPKGQPAQRYVPPVFKEPAGRLVVAIRTKSELAPALQIKREVQAAAIVLIDERAS